VSLRAHSMVAVGRAAVEVDICLGRPDSGDPSGADSHCIWGCKSSALQSTAALER
jgi:hypothetical protein